MNNTTSITLLMILAQFTQLFSSEPNDQETIVEYRKQIINKALHEYPILAENLDLLHEENNDVANFTDYLEERLVINHKKSNIEKILKQAHKITKITMEKKFLKILNHKIINPDDYLAPIEEKVFQYALKKMSKTVRTWVNIPGGHNSFTPLHKAVWCNNSQIIPKLLKIGADIDAQDATGDTPLYLAAFKNHSEVSRILIHAQANLNIQNAYGNTALYKATFNNCKDIARMLIHAGADLNIQDEHGNTPLYEAVFNNHQEIASLLIGAGADLNTQSKIEKFTPLHVAVVYSHSKLVKKLLEMGADTTIKCQEGYTAEEFSTFDEIQAFFGQKKTTLSCRFPMIKN